jgi:uncharacterized membrane protein YcaP (DUF421 family)
MLAGAIVSASMQMSDHGILEGFLLLLCALFFQRGISFLGVRSSRFEELTQGRPGMLVREGVLRLEELKEFHVSRQQVFAQLRNPGIYNLGAVERMYLEASGMYSIFSAAEPKPGLSVLPPDDPKIQTVQTADQSLMACSSCGQVQPKSDQSCKDCGCEQWTKAVK